MTAVVEELAVPQAGGEGQESAGVTQWRHRTECGLSGAVSDFHGYQTLSLRPAEALGKMAREDWSYTEGDGATPGSWTLG